MRGPVGEVPAPGCGGYDFCELQAEEVVVAFKERVVRVLEGRLSRPRGSHPGTSFRVTQPEGWALLVDSWVARGRVGRRQRRK